MVQLVQQVQAVLVELQEQMVLQELVVLLKLQELAEHQVH